MRCKTALQSTGKIFVAIVIFSIIVDREKLLQEKRQEENRMALSHPKVLQGHSPYDAMIFDFASTLSVGMQALSQKIENNEEAMNMTEAELKSLENSIKETEKDIETVTRRHQHSRQSRADLSKKRLDNLEQQLSELKKRYEKDKKALEEKKDEEILNCDTQIGMIDAARDADLEEFNKNLNQLRGEVKALNVRKSQLKKRAKRLDNNMDRNVEFLKINS